ncbi:MAG: hypothetical protein DCC75_14170 [Proteobacteria bacterium]|nr:MAG: hypothetical protein DCC75_14170 [Pseudomonadota bacterium]
MAFECFTGQRPFPGDNFNTVIGNILNGKPLPLSMLNPALPLTLEAEFERALAKEAQQRFNSARATVEAFAEALGIDKKEAEKAGAGHNLPDLPRKRPSSGWKTVIDLASRRKQAESNQTDSPGYTPASGQDNSPWRYVDRPINWREDSPSGRVLRNTPGAIFSGSATEELSKAGNLSRFDFGSPLVRRLIKLSLLACFGLVGTLIWVLSDYDFDRNPVKVPAQKLSRNSALKPVENPAIEHSARIELPAPGKAITELKNAELLGVISDRNQSEERIVGALAEAGNRNSFVVRVAAIKVISESADSRAVPLLVPLIDDYDPLVRGHAAKALGRLGNKSALGYLMTRYKSENFPQVKQALKKSIERINGFPLKD